MNTSTPKYAWITGASRGIGLSTAQEFLSNHWNVVVLTRNIKPLQQLQLEYPEQLTLISLDLLSFSKAELPNLPVDVLINNAGALINKPMSEISMEDLQRIYTINVFAPFQLINLLRDQFRPDTHIVNISSVGGVQGSVKFPGLTAYSSSKGALSILTECLQAEFQDTELAFNCLALGAVQTEMLQEAFPGYDAPIAPKDLSPYIFNFATSAHRVMKGKIISVSLTTP
ncbi:MAG: Gluconate 5-dehydrogenase [Cryomorphaceae bacterium]|nr:MAG: Gluconate 5-dehydrogenase [Cryomorphaceae bacterium]